ncbi:MAG: P-loop NTPase [Coriobacteriales bacterium]|nr:P-loop NTPase [Coriobacteriales bacterium]
MNEKTIAYSVSLSQEGAADDYGGRGDLDGIYAGGGWVNGSSGNVNGNSDRKEVVRMFTSSELCRTTLRGESAAVPVIVCNEKDSVTPINLAAALCMDTPERDVYLIEDMPTKALAGRARAAGIRGILDNSQAQRLLALGQGSVVPSSREAGVREVSTDSAFAAPTAPECSSPGQGRAIGIFSGRGGVGKSTVALMTAFAAQKRGSRVALVDLDMQFGDIGFLAGREPAGNIQRLDLAQLCIQRSIPSLSDEALTLVLAPGRPEQAEQLASAIPWLFGELAALRDMVVINTGSFWADVHARVIQCCDHIALLTDQRATSIEACKQVIDLCLRLQVPQARFLFLLNGCGRHAALTPQDVSLALGGVEVFGLADGGALVDELLALGCPLELLASGNALVTSLETLLDVLTGRYPISIPAESSGQGADRRTNRGAKVFDIAVLRDFFSGAHRVAT